MTAYFARRLIWVGLGVLLAGPATAGPAYDTASGGTFQYYGQFNPAYLSFDDGATTTSELADNTASNSRVGFTFLQPFGDNELLFRFETGLGFRPTALVSQTATPDAVSWDRTVLRYIDFRYRTARYGTFYLGQGSMASDGIGDRSLAGTGLATPVSIGDTAGSFVFRTSTGALSGVTIRSAFATYDGGRGGRIRYDTPSFAGFSLRLAYGRDVLDILGLPANDDFYDIALAYADTLDNGIEIEAGLGYQVLTRTGARNPKDTFGSFTMALPSGFNFTFTAGERNTAGSYYFTKLGYKADFWSVGETALSVDYYSSSDQVTAGDHAELWGIGITQDFDAINLEAYFGYRAYSYSDATPVTYQDANSFVLGTRWRF